MRLLLLFGFLAFSTLFISCGGDDDIEGTWAVQSVSSTDCADPLDNFSESGYSLTPCTETSADGCASFILTFAATTYTTSTIATFNGGVFSEDGSGTYTIDGDRLTLCEDGTDCDGGTFSLDGNTMTLVSDPDEDGCVTTLVATKS